MFLGLEDLPLFSGLLLLGLLHFFEFVFFLSNPLVFLLEVLLPNFVLVDVAVDPFQYFLFKFFQFLESVGVALCDLFEPALQFFFLFFVLQSKGLQFHVAGPICLFAVLQSVLKQFNGTFSGDYSFLAVSAIDPDWFI